jgi:hypothetical protein
MKGSKAESGRKNRENKKIDVYVSDHRSQINSCVGSCGWIVQVNEAKSPAGQRCQRKNWALPT